MKPVLQMRAATSLVMTPQVQQSLRLLQLSALEFSQELQSALVANPFLEVIEDGEDTAAESPSDAEGTLGEQVASDAPGERSLDDLAMDMDPGAPVTREPHADRGDFEGRIDAAHGPTLREHLNLQIGASHLNERDRLLAAIVADSVDSDGYLRQDAAELIEAFPQLEIGEEELAIALRFVQSLDPAGVAARTPAECLSLQLERLPADTPGRALALALVREHLPLLAAHDTLRLCRALECDEDALHEANVLILGLQPRPGERFAAEETRYVVADVLVKQVNGQWRACINPQVIPKLRINRRYVEVFRSERGNGEQQPLAHELQEARWLLRSIWQRFNTIQRVAQAIVERQRRFFDHGDVAMQPLLQRDVAEALGMHESTVSRVAHGKYMATPLGLYEFKRFFDGHVHATDGQPCSTTAVRALIRDLVAREDPQRPLSDIKLMRKLAERGVSIARRTVTKYRDGLRIPPWQARRLAAPVSRRS